MDIEVKRGVIAITQTKAQTLANIPLGDRENWGADSFQIDEVLGEGNVGGRFVRGSDGYQSTSSLTF
jgi:hypothetical protein